MNPDMGSSVAAADVDRPIVPFRTVRPASTAASTREDSVEALVVILTAVTSCVPREPRH